MVDGKLIVLCSLHRKWYYKGLLCEEVIKIYVDKSVGKCIKEACQGVH